MPWLRLLVTCVLRWRIGFETTSIHVKRVVSKLRLGQDFLEALLFPLSVTFHQSSTLLFPLSVTLHQCSTLMFPLSVTLYQCSTLLFPLSVTLHQCSTLLFPLSVTLHQCSTLLFPLSVTLHQCPTLLFPLSVTLHQCSTLLFFLSVRLYQCSTLISIYMLLLPEGKLVPVWGPTKKTHIWECSLNIALSLCMKVWSVWPTGVGCIYCEWCSLLCS